MTRAPRCLAPIAIVAVLASCELEPVRPPFGALVAGPLLGNAPVEKVTGGGRVEVSGIWPGVADAQVSFTVSTREDGVTSGNLVAHFSAPDETVHMDVTCLAVSGTEAWMGGSVTFSHPDDTFLGQVFILRVQDNGSGETSQPDRISHFRAGGALGPDRCLNQPTGSPEFDLRFPLLSGNLTIH